LRKLKGSRKSTMGVWRLESRPKKGKLRRGDDGSFGENPEISGTRIRARQTERAICFVGTGEKSAHSLLIHGREGMSVQETEFSQGFKYRKAIRK